MHDFTHHIVGFQDDPEFKTVLENRIDVSTPSGIQLAVRMYKWLPLPWVYIWSPWVVFYIGWSSGGKFGLKLRRSPENMR